MMRPVRRPRYYAVLSPWFCVALRKISITIFLSCTACFFATGCASNQMNASMQTQPFAAILRAQADAWNRGDIDGFMAHYWKSEQLTFSSGGETQRGWTATYE